MLNSNLSDKQNRLSTYESQSFASEFTATHDGFALISATKDVAGSISSVTYQDTTANVPVGGVVMSPDFTLGVYQYENFPIIKGHKYVRSGITNISALVERVLY